MLNQMKVVHVESSRIHCKCRAQKGQCHVLNSLVPMRIVVHDIKWICISQEYIFICDTGKQWENTAEVEEFSMGPTMDANY